MDHVIATMNESITNNFSSSHQALDIVGEGGSISDVISIADGTVEIVVKNVKYTNNNARGTASYGNFVKIKHDNGHYTLYAHMKYGSITVSQGDKVTKGQTLGTMGSTGNAYGIHLHFEVRDSNNNRLNPKDYLDGIKSINPVNNPIEAPPAETNADIIQEEQNETPKEETNKEEKVEEKIETENIEESKETEKINGIITTENPSNSLELAKEAKPSEETYLENANYKGPSIVDGLKQINIDSTYTNRENIALKNGITDYKGTYCQNIYLLKLLKTGKLKI